ncbi:hypothetical protein Bca52824_008170 [Brassica carinata]|uniref:Uncharacterized protein n=1 Tax=Brassica carinata TaxID=52824 RepID=A0A8X7W9N1_BRACI|nr:hypothetical protein Bca52824_008170 [Brassica carinata]
MASPNPYAKHPSPPRSTVAATPPPSVSPAGGGFLCKSVLLGMFILALPLFPSQAPDFVGETVLTKLWELIHLLFVGIAVAYGLFSRRNVESNVESRMSCVDESSLSYVSRILQVSSVFDHEEEEELLESSSLVVKEMNKSEYGETNQVQAWNSRYFQGRSKVVVARPAYGLDGHVVHQSLGLPVRSLRSGLRDNAALDDNEKAEEESLADDEVMAAAPSSSPWHSSPEMMAMGDDYTSNLQPLSVDETRFTTRSSRSSVSSSSSSSSSSSHDQNRFSPSRSVSGESLNSNVEELDKEKSLQGSSRSSSPSLPPSPPLSPSPELVTDETNRRVLHSRHYSDGSLLEEDVRQGFEDELEVSKVRGFSKKEPGSKSLKLTAESSWKGKNKSRRSYPPDLMISPPPVDGADRSTTRRRYLQQKSDSHLFEDSIGKRLESDHNKLRVKKGRSHDSLELAAVNSTNEKASRRAMRSSGGGSDTLVVKEMNKSEYGETNQVQAWNSRYFQGRSKVVVARPAYGLDGHVVHQSLGLPVRSLRSGLRDNAALDDNEKAEEESLADDEVMAAAPSSSPWHSSPEMMAMGDDYTSNLQPLSVDETRFTTRSSRSSVSSSSSSHDQNRFSPSRSVSGESLNSNVEELDKEKSLQGSSRSSSPSLPPSPPLSPSPELVTDETNRRVLHSRHYSDGSLLEEDVRQGFEDELEVSKVRGFSKKEPGSKSLKLTAESSWKGKNKSRRSYPPDLMISPPPVDGADRSTTRRRYLQQKSDSHLFEDSIGKRLESDHNKLRVKKGRSHDSLELAAVNSTNEKASRRAMRSSGGGSDTLVVKEMNKSEYGETNQVQAWNSRYFQGRSKVVVARPAYGLDGHVVHQSLGLPVRSLRSGLRDNAALDDNEKAEEESLADDEVMAAAPSSSPWHSSPEMMAMGDDYTSNLQPLSVDETRFTTRSSRSSVSSSSSSHDQNRFSPSRSVSGESLNSNVEELDKEKSLQGSSRSSSPSLPPSPPLSPSPELVTDETNRRVLHSRHYSDGSLLEEDVRQGFEDELEVSKVRGFSKKEPGSKSLKLTAESSWKGKNKSRRSYPPDLMISPPPVDGADRSTTRRRYLQQKSDSHLFEDSIGKRLESDHNKLRVKKGRSHDSLELAAVNSTNEKASRRAMRSSGGGSDTLVVKDNKRNSADDSEDYDLPGDNKEAISNSPRCEPQSWRASSKVSSRGKSVRTIRSDRHGDSSDDRTESHGRTKQRRQWQQELAIVLHQEKHSEPEDDVREETDTEAEQPQETLEEEEEEEEAAVWESQSNVSHDHYEVDKKADAFIAKFREQIRLQKLHSGEQRRGGGTGVIRNSHFR